LNYAFSKSSRHADIYVIEIKMDRLHFSVAHRPHCVSLDTPNRSNKQETDRCSHYGRETANVHMDSRNAMKQVRKHLKLFKRDGLASAAKKMTKSVAEDWEMGARSTKPDQDVPF